CNDTFTKNASTLVRQVHIVYNNVYEVPVLWFNFYKQGNYRFWLVIDEVLELITTDYRSSIKSTLLTSLSQGEHPNIGVAFYHIHPCKTQDVMRNLHYTNYILSWISVYGQLVGLTLPSEIYEKANAMPPNNFKLNCG
uniref:Ubiquitin-like-conjugating enzyme ATG10 n=1 Tax=Syphacia muris TaxID=451379 RepID=A0A0N5AD18_9BILA